MTTTEHPDGLADFEQTLQELEALTERMERGEQGLEAALADFERGIGLVRHCRTALDTAEQKVEILMQRDGRNELEPFAGVDDD